MASLYKTIEAYDAGRLDAKINKIADIGGVLVHYHVTPNGYKLLYTAVMELGNVMPSELEALGEL